MEQPTFKNRQARGLPKVDGRTREGRIMRAFRADLIDFVGGDPDVIQREIIERAVWLQLRCSLMDAKIAAGEDTQYDSATYLSWTANLQRALCRLGYKENAEVLRKKAELALARAYGK